MPCTWSSRSCLCDGAAFRPGRREAGCLLQCALAKDLDNISMSPLVGIFPKWLSTNQSSKQIRLLLKDNHTPAPIPRPPLPRVRLRRDDNFAFAGARAASTRDHTLAAWLERFWGLPVLGWEELSGLLLRGCSDQGDAFIAAAGDDRRPASWEHTQPWCVHVPWVLFRVRGATAAAEQPRRVACGVGMPAGDESKAAAGTKWVMGVVGRGHSRTTPLTHGPRGPSQHAPRRRVPDTAPPQSRGCLPCPGPLGKLERVEQAQRGGVGSPVVAPRLRASVQWPGSAARSWHGGAVCVWLFVGKEPKNPRWWWWWGARPNGRRYPTRRRRRAAFRVCARGREREDGGGLAGSVSARSAGLWCAAAAAGAPPRACPRCAAAAEHSR